MALIDDGRGGELLCYEFKVKNGDDSYIMHISTADGSEREISYYFEDKENFYTK